MRIVFVLSGLGAGGAEKIVNLLAHHRVPANDSVHVVAVNAKRPQSYFPYDSSITVEAWVTLSEHPVSAQRRTDCLRFDGAFEPSNPILSYPS